MDAAAAAQPQDAILKGLMEQTFGPPDDEDRGERMQRGLEEVARHEAGGGMRLMVA